MASLPGYKNTELEDFVSISTYLPQINDELGMNLSEADITKDDKKRAWSERMKIIVEAGSKPHTKKLEMKLKHIVATQAAANPSTSLNPKRCQPVDALINSIEQFLAH